MTTKANKLRAAARKRIALNQKAVESEVKRSANREVLLSAEAKALIEEMREHGFCSPGSIPTVKQYSRYAAFRNSRAASKRAAAIDDETAVYAANGGVMDLVFDRLRNPKIKDTAFAQLAVLAQRGLAMAPQLVDEVQRVSVVSEQNILDEDDLDLLSGDLGGDE